MRKTLMTLALVITLSSCAPLRSFGVGMCETQTEISDGITELGGWAGPPGMVAARVINLVLSTTCKVLSGAVTMPAEVSDDMMRMFVSEKPEAAGDGN